MVTHFQRYHPSDWAEMQKPNNEANESEESQGESADDLQHLQAEMDSLGTEYSTLVVASITERFAFIPAHPKLIAYVSSTFLDHGWLHLITTGFLWVAGFLATFGLSFVPLFQPAGGYCGDTASCLGEPAASVHRLSVGGRCGIDGAFLVRFPKLKIRGFMWFFTSDSPAFAYLGRADWLLPRELVTEIYYGKPSGRVMGLDIGRTSED